MKKLTLDLTQYDMFVLACSQLGEFFSEDSTADECMAFLDNIKILKENMGEEFLEKFNILSRQFEQRKDEIKEKAGELMERFGGEMTDILFG